MSGLVQHCLCDTIEFHCCQVDILDLKKSEQTLFQILFELTGKCIFFVHVFRVDIFSFEIFFEVILYVCDLYSTVDYILD